MSHRLPLLATIVTIVLPPIPAAGQSPPAATLVIAVARDIATPVPTLWSDQPNREISDLMFLRLADLGPGLGTAGEKGFVARLARRWERRDPLTLVFELDRRARWHDGEPVTSRDVIFALDRARDPLLAPQTATLLKRLKSVTAEGDYRVVARFSEPYAEQFYDVTYHVPPLPAHLLERIPADSLAQSPFMAHPVGNGPYAFVRRTPGQLVELAANETFFLGRPGIRRILVLIAPSAETRVNLLLTGQVDALDNIYALENWSRVDHLPDYQYYPVPGSNLQYADFNERDPADTSRPHLIFSDPGVRRALTGAIDRERVMRTAYGPLAQVANAPLSALLLRNVKAPPPIPFDTAAARRLLASRGWLDHNGDGILDKDGRPLAFKVMIPSVVAARVKMGTLMQESWRLLGVQAELDIVEPSEFTRRRNAGKFDLELTGASQDPSPSGLAQTWSCAGFGGSNVAHYCNPAVDSLLQGAIVSPPGRMARLYQEAVRRIGEDAPAIFLAAPVLGSPVHRRFTNVVVRPESAWLMVWQWTLRAGQQIDRDGR